MYFTFDICLGFLILTAVGIDASMIHSYSSESDMINNMVKGLKMEFYLPWAIIVSGIGGVFALVAGMVIAMHLVFRDRREAPGVWKQMQMQVGRPF